MNASGMKLATRLALGFGFVVALLVLAAGWSILSLREGSHGMAMMVEDRVPKIIKAQEIVNDINIIARAMRNSLLVKSSDAVTKELARIAEARESIKTNLAYIDERVNTEQGRKIVDAIKSNRAAYITLQDEFIRLANAGKRDEAIEFLITQVREPQAQYLSSVDKYVEYVGGLMAEEGQASAAATTRDTWILIALTIAGLLAATLTATILIGRISRQLGGEPDYAAEVVRQIAEGDLSQTVRLKAGDTTSLLASMKTMQEALQKIVGEIQDTVNAALKGDFSQKISLADKRGFTEDIASGLNQLSDITDTGLRDVLRVANALSAGDLTQKIDKDYPGVFGQTRAAVNGTVNALSKIVAEIEGIVEAAAARGDFSVKMTLEGKAGYTKRLSDLLNQLSTVTDTGLRDVMRVANALSAGDLSQRIEAEYPGVFGQTKAGVNGTVAALTKIVAEIKNIVESAAVRGDFSVKMALEGKAGYTKELSELLNQLSNVTDTGLLDVLRVANALAKGDLTQRIERDYPGVFGEVRDGMNTTVSNLKELVQQIKASVDTINVASQEIAVGNADLSQRTEEQASSLEETASSIEELTSTVKQNADNANQANQLALGASGIAGKGGEVVGNVVVTMTGINDASRKIVDIISVIDGIAFQTNILALNAAVEAARAGEQGRGFAVVAGEVRNLAQRSAAAAKEIKFLINDTVEKVTNGTKQVEEAGSTMSDIVSSVKRVTSIISEISSASLEQSAGIEQVNQAIAQMDQVTQQNAALVEEAAAAADSLSGQARNLAEAVAVFKMDQTSSSTAVAAPRTPTPPAAPRHAPKTQPRAGSAKPAGKSPAKAKHASAGEEDEWSEF
jgi:methyl-accepting chemotaxis protein